MATSVNRQTVDLRAWPDLVVVYLGMKVNAFAGIRTALGLGPQIQRAGEARPDGLLHCEQGIIYRVFPFHVGMRWYWRDFESLERWTRSDPHRIWWQNFLRNTGGTGFWHETYAKAGGIEAIFDDIAAPLGLKAFAPAAPARGSMFSARTRLNRPGGPAEAAPDGMSEPELHER
jgi:hypothetical protein